MCIFFVLDEKKSTYLLLTHLASVNIVHPFFKTMPKAVVLGNLLGDIGCKIPAYLERVILILGLSITPATSKWWFMPSPFVSGP